jgi:hypothetical protein
VCRLAQDRDRTHGKHVRSADAPAPDTRPAAERHIVTVDNVVRDLITLRDEARAAKQYAAAAKCQQLVGMTIGSFVDRREISTPREALDTELEQLAAQLGMSADDLARRLMN